MQCVKSLWLKKYNKDVLTLLDASAKAIFETGNEVGELAYKLFPNGIEVEFNPKDYEEMISTTQSLINSM